MLGDAAGNRVQNDRDVDIAVGRQLIACAGAVKVHASQAVAIDRHQAAAGLGRVMGGMFATWEEIVETTVADKNLSLALDIGFSTAESGLQGCKGRMA